MSDDDKLFPLVDRRAPIATRVRQFRNGRGGKQMGKVFGKVLTAESQEDRDEVVTEFGKQFEQGLASQLGVDEEDINDDLVAELQLKLIELTPEDVMTEQSLIEQGIIEPESESADGESIRDRLTSDSDDQDDDDDLDEEEASDDTDEEESEEPEASMF